MNLISQLTQRITPLILTHSSQMTASESSTEQALLEQFYALVGLRLTESAVQQRLSDESLAGSRAGPDIIPADTGELGARDISAKRNLSVNERLNHSVNSAGANNATDEELTFERLFTQLWPVAQDRQTIIHELAEGYYVTDLQAEDLIQTALPLLYIELLHLSRQQQLSLTELLTPQVAIMRAYIAPWAAPLLLTGHGELTSTSADPFTETQDANVDALHARPAAEHDPARLHNSHKRDNKSLLLLFTLGLGLLILAGLAWLAFNQYQQSKVVEPAEVTTPVAPAATTTTASRAALTPVKLTLKMDVGQSLYECQATVGNAQLEEALVNALITGLGEQARQCLITIDANTATEMTSLPTLAGILSVVLPINFATVELQDNTLSLSAPDPDALNQMIMQIQAMAPALTIKVLEPIVPVDNSLANINGMDTGANAADANAGMSPDLAANLNEPMQRESNIPAMTDNSTGYAANNSSNDNPTNYNPAIAPNRDNPVTNNSSAPSGPISESELDELANVTIVAEPAQGGRPVQ